MPILKVEQYKEAIRVLYPKQREILEELYRFPNSCATQEQLIVKINPLNPKPFIARSRIGKAGKSIADFCGVSISNTEIYANVVSEPYDKTGVGWRMHKNLKTAMEQLLSNTNKF